MLSILIPNYNFDVTKLIIDLHKLAVQENLIFEIILGEDGTTNEISHHHRSLINLEHFSIYREEKTVGRASIRNNLARKANYNWLLFIDSDAILTDTFSLSFYLESGKGGKVICGGTRYAKGIPDLASRKLRWEYGRAREEISADNRNLNPYASFSTFNFLIKKEVFFSILFEESLSDYGHEDTLFGYRLKEKNIPVFHIENSLIHSGLDENRVFIDKTRQAVRNLSLLVQKLDFKPDFLQLVTLLKTYAKLKRFRLIPLVVVWFKLFEKWMIAQLMGKRPSIKLFQLYKLGYFCSLLYSQNK